MRRLRRLRSERGRRRDGRDRRRHRRQRSTARNAGGRYQSDFSRPSRRAISASSESRSAKGSSTLGDGLPLGAAFVLSPGGRASAGFCAPLDVGADGGAFGAGRGWPRSRWPRGTAVAADAAGGSVFAVVTTWLRLRRRRLPVPLSQIGARRRRDGRRGRRIARASRRRCFRGANRGSPRFAATLAGTIGGGIVARGCAGRRLRLTRWRRTGRRWSSRLRRRLRRRRRSGGRARQFRRGRLGWERSCGVERAAGLAPSGSAAPRGRVGGAVAEIAAGGAVWRRSRGRRGRRSRGLSGDLRRRFGGRLRRERGGLGSPHRRALARAEAKPGCSRAPGPRRD